MKRKSIAAITLILAFVLCACAGGTKFSLEDFKTHQNTTAVTHTFLTDDDSERIVFSENGLREFKASCLSQPVTYGYDELFNYEEATSRMERGLIVTDHAHTALDQSGTLTGAHLFELVRENNRVYLDSAKTSILADVDDELLHRVCEIIVETTNDILQQYPDIDKSRVYCNLGNLKVLEKDSALDFAAVEPGMLLHLNPNTAQTASLFTSSNMYNVLVHETMHIIQYGCECEQIDGCIRRCGLAYAYSGDGQDYADWLWLSEGSAERMACLYTNVEPMTYTTLVNYILSLDLAVALNDSVPANYVETIAFYNDLDRLYEPFDAETKAEKEEIYRMIYALEIMQMEPSDVKESYARIYGKEWTAEVRDDINNKVKRPLVQTLTKHFYSNLADAIMNKHVTKNDVLFLLNLFDSTINYHLLFTNSKYDPYNADFVLWYTDVQTAFFSTLENVSPEDYMSYQPFDEATKTVTASVSWLDEAKQAFLLEKFEDHFCDYKFIP